MQSRTVLPATTPGLVETMAGLEERVNRLGFDPRLLELVKLRSSLINARYCVDIHAKAARSLGETEQRLYSVGLWKEAPFFTDRERAALAWTEAVTLGSSGHAPDDAYQLARSQFTEKELADLTRAIAAINAWNRLAATFRTASGTFQLERPSRQRRLPRASRSSAPRTTKGIKEVRHAGHV